MLRKYLLLTSPYLEARWPSELTRDYYALGGYTLTLSRVNGLFEESSALAANVGIFFAPLGIAVGSLRGRAAALGLPLLALSILLPAGSGSMTGLILAVPALTLCFAFKTPRSLRAAAFLLICAGAIAAAALPIAQKRIGSFVRDAADSPRAVITLTALDLIQKHPLLGVGRGNFSARAIEEERYVKAAALEEQRHGPGPFSGNNQWRRELRDWRDAGYVAQLAMLPIFAAEYGLPVLLCCLFGLLKIRTRLLRLRRENPEDALSAFMATGYSAWLLMAAVGGCGSVDPRNPLFVLPLLFALAYTEKRT
jgi:hypothetical protein